MRSLPKVLFVDDNVNLLNAMKRVMRKKIDLTVAESGEKALQILQRRSDFAVIVSDQNMPNMKGDTLLLEVASKWPSIVRVMLTGNDDQQTVINAVNNGNVFRFVRKPSEPEALLETILEGVAQHQILSSEKQLLETTLAGSVKVLTDILATVRPGLFQRAARVKRSANIVANFLDLPRAWELDLAAMLYPLGATALDANVTAKYDAGQPLDEDEQILLDRSCATAAELISNVPRMENVAKGIQYCRKGFDGSGFPDGDVQGDKLPFIARILMILIDAQDAFAAKLADRKTMRAYLQQRAERYDPRLLSEICNILELTTDNLENAQGDLIFPSPIDVLVDDVLVADLKDGSGELLLSAGTQLSETMIQRISKQFELGNLPKKIAVSRMKEAA